MLAAAALLTIVPATAHHSFDMFFDRTKPVKLTGIVTSFRFTDPHGMITLSVKGSDGKPQLWQAETTGSNGMTRAGWDQHSVKPGETLIVDGWAARNDKPMIRLHAAHHADGRLIGAAIYPDVPWPGT